MGYVEKASELTEERTNLDCLESTELLLDIIDIIEQGVNDARLRR